MNDYQCALATLLVFLNLVDYFNNHSVRRHELYRNEYYRE